MRKPFLAASLLCVLIRKALPLPSLKAPPLRRGGGRPVLRSSESEAGRPEGFGGRGLLRHGRDTYFVVILLFATIATSVFAVNGNMGGGDGSETTPYLIEDVNDFDTFANPANAATYWAAGVHTKLATDIDLSGRTYTTAVIAPDTDTDNAWDGFDYNGNFDGDGYDISILSISDGYNYIGLFGNIGNTGSITDLGLNDVDISGTGLGIGGLCGMNSGDLMNCRTTGIVSDGHSSTGGLCGRNYGRITNCNTVVVTNGLAYVGGLCGSNGGSIIQCYANGTVNGTGYRVGGLCGSNYLGNIESSYAIANISGVDYVGGLVGANNGSVTNCFATGLISGNDNVGGLIGDNSASVTESFWDIGNSGIADPEEGLPDTDGMIGKTTAEMMTQGTFAGWDFTTPVWVMLRPGEDYPRLAWQEVFMGDIAGLYGVDLVDFARLAGQWGEPVCDASNQWCQGADIDHADGVDIKDLAAVAEDWLK